MAACGISGAFNHRFMTEWSSPLNKTRTIVLGNIKSITEATGQFNVSHGMAQNGNAVIERLKTDWMILMDMEGIINKQQPVHGAARVALIA
jgi:hypothetical protein